MRRQQKTRLSESAYRRWFRPRHGKSVECKCSQTPLVVTAGQQDSRHTTTDPLLLGDLVGMGKTFAKWSQEVTHVDQLPVLVRRAFHDSDAAPKGSVFLSLPMDVMEAMSAIGIGAPYYRPQCSRGFVTFAGE